MSEFKEGLYDQLVTRRLREFLDRQPGLKSAVDALEEADCPDYLARHLIRQIKSALRGMPSEDRQRRQIQLANTLLEFVRAQQEDPAESDPIDPLGELLRALYRGASPPVPPSTPLGATTLLMNALDEPRLGFELERELATADRVFMVVSFVQWRGWQRLKSAFLDLAERQAPIYLLTTTYIGATDFRAIQELARLPNVEVRISLDGRRRRLHAKAWLFQRDNGFSSVYVGSANLSGPALEDGIEWTVKLSEVEAPHIVDRFFSEVLLDRVRLHTEEAPALSDCPLFLHRQYMRDEVLVGLGMPEQIGARHTQTGRFWIEAINTEIFFVTLDKSEKAFSPSTRYEDFAVSPSRFHWQSQSTTGEDSPTGRRYVFQKQNGSRFLLFVRPKRGDPFVFLGPLHYVSHIGSRPMSIYWDLEHPMPAWFFEICASLRAA